MNDTNAQSQRCSDADCSPGLERRGLTPHVRADLRGTRLTRQAVTKHLRGLQSARVVRSVRSGRENLFELNPAPIRQVREYAEVVSEQWARALMRLKVLVERTVGLGSRSSRRSMPR